MFRSFGSTIRNDAVGQTIKNWINLNDRPLVYEYNDRTSSELFT